MASTITQARRAIPVLKTETVAKAHLRKAEELGGEPLREPEPDAAYYRRQVGGAVDRMRTLAGLTLDQLADRIDRDSRQIARWINGEERPQFDVLFADRGLRRWLLVAFAELDEEAEIDIAIRFRVQR